MKLLIPILFLLQACITQPLSVETIYRKDMQVSIGKMQFIGVGVLDKTYRYDIKMRFFKNPNIVKFSTCHRYLTWEKPGLELNFVYVPEPAMEQRGYCPLEIGAFDDKAQLSSALFDFRSEANETLVGEVTCNGDSGIPYVGTSICQSHAGLIQKISFLAPAKVGSQEGCPIAETKDGKEFIIKMGRGKCLYEFKSGKEDHRLIMFGFEDVIIRG